MPLDFRYAFIVALAFSSASSATERTAQSQVASVTEKCGVIFEESPGNTKSQLLPSLHLIDMTASSVFSLPEDSPANVKAVQCGRQSLVPLATDIKVIAAGFPLAIVSDDRVGVLEIIDGRLRFNMLEGEMTESEIHEIGDFLNTGQLALSEQEAHGNSADLAP